MNPGSLPPALRQPWIVKAHEEQEMLTQNEIERERYDARFKALCDHATYMKEAGTEGRDEGLDQGIRRGKLDVIRALERLLRRPQTSAEVLNRLPLDDLSKLAADMGELANQG